MPVLERKIVHQHTTMCSHIIYPQFVLPLHKHAEYEIMLFTRGGGKQFVGEGEMEFKTGDVALIGSNVPHLHLCRSKLHPEEECEASGGEVLQFHPSLFPVDMENIPDYQTILTLLQKSQYGIRFSEEGLMEELLERFTQLDSLEYTARLIALLQILDRLSACKNTTTLSPTAYNSTNLMADTNEPVSKVYTYLYNHFKQDVKLCDIADYARQNATALCRSFKRATDKSIFQVLAEIRIGHARRLLTHSNLTISQIAYESGYSSVSHFIAQFRDIVHLTPSEYRSEIKK